MKMKISIGFAFVVDVAKHSERENHVVEDAQLHLSKMADLFSVFMSHLINYFSRFIFSSRIPF